MRFAHVLHVCLLIAPLGCSASSESSSLSELEAELGYPPASYRFALSRINNVHLFVAHILITHQASAPKDEGPMFVERSSRSRESALRLAAKLSQQLAKRPDSFADLARRYSEDRHTAAHGGVLGVVEAPALPMTVLDAIAAIAPGQVSHVLARFHT